jgi:hypothetical protein
VLREAAHKLIAHGAGRVPGLKRLPVLKLLAVAEIALVARTHVTKLEPDERRRFIQLVRAARGRPSKLTEAEREELSKLVSKAEPRLFAGVVADKLSPVPLPKRLVTGKRRGDGQPAGPRGTSGP